MILTSQVILCVKIHGRFSTSEVVSFLDFSSTHGQSLINNNIKTTKTLLLLFTIIYHNNNTGKYFFAFMIMQFIEEKNVVSFSLEWVLCFSCNQ